MGSLELGECVRGDTRPAATQYSNPKDDGQTGGVCGHVDWYPKGQAEASTEADHDDLPALSARGRVQGSMISLPLYYTCTCLDGEKILVYLCAAIRDPTSVTTDCPHYQSSAMSTMCLISTSVARMGCVGDIH